MTNIIKRIVGHILNNTEAPKFDDILLNSIKDENIKEIEGVEACVYPTNKFKETITNVLDDTEKMKILEIERIRTKKIDFTYPQHKITKDDSFLCRAIVDLEIIKDCNPDDKLVELDLKFIECIKNNFRITTRKEVKLREVWDSSCLGDNAKYYTAVFYLEDKEYKKTEEKEKEDEKGVDTLSGQK